MHTNLSDFLLHFKTITYNMKITKICGINSNNIYDNNLGIDFNNEYANIYHLLLTIKYIAK